MTNLSPAAQAVLDALYADRMTAKWRGILDLPVVAAALRAAADQVVPEEPLYVGDQRWMFERDSWRASRKKLLAIAAELEAYAQ
jgi:hypothetical protein